jgi:hypothetical protein
MLLILLFVLEKTQFVLFVDHFRDSSVIIDFITVLGREAAK